MKLVRPLDRKIAVISLTKTLTDSKAFAVRYKKGWGLTCDELLKLLINPPVLSPTEDAILDHDVDDMTFGVGFTQLTTIKKAPRDSWPEVTNIKSWVGDFIKTADTRHGGQISEFVKERLTPESRETLVAYMQH